MPGPFSMNGSDGGWLHHPELYLRWMQASIFHPIFRTHVSDGGDPSPWVYPNFELMQQAFQFRNALVPYLYTAAAISGYKAGILPVRPVYYDYQEWDRAYTVSALNGPNKPVQFLFGNDFTVAPITAFADKNSQKINWYMWIPVGTWVDWYTGISYEGPLDFQRNYSQSEIPMFVRELAIIPMKTMESRKQLVADPLVLMVVMGGQSGSFSSGALYEDDGDTLQYQNGAWSVHVSAVSIVDGGAKFDFNACIDGNGFSSAPDSRSYLLKFRSAPPSSSNVTCAECPPAFTWFWENDGNVAMFVVSTGVLPYNQSFTVEFEY